MTDEYQNWGGDDAPPNINGSTGSNTITRYGGTANIGIAQHRLSTVTCPSDVSNLPIRGIPNINYLVNIGQTANNQATINGVLFQDAPFTPRKFLSTDANVRVVTPGGWLVRPWRGVATNEIIDGLSNTLMMMEIQQGQRTDLRGFARAIASYLPSKPVRMRSRMSVFQPAMSRSPDFTENLSLVHLPPTTERVKISSVQDASALVVSPGG